MCKFLSPSRRLVWSAAYRDQFTNNPFLRFHWFIQVGFEWKFKPFSIKIQELERNLWTGTFSKGKPYPSADTACNSLNLRTTKCWAVNGDTFKHLRTRWHLNSCHSECVWNCSVFHYFHKCPQISLSSPYYSTPTQSPLKKHKIYFCLILLLHC